MAQKPEEQLKEFGSKLDLPPVSKDSLLKLLKEATVCLSELEQSPPPAVLKSIQPFLDAVIKPEILNHQDRDVKLLVASCVSEITRITAPEAPYADNIMKDIFQLIVSAFTGLNDVSGPSFGRRVVILETVAKYRSCVVMLDLECDDLVKEVFTTFLDVARDDHPEMVFSSMQNIMTVLLEESEDVQEHLLLILLSKLGRNRSDVRDAARRLAMKVIEHCAPKVESDIKQFLISSMSGDSRFSSSQIDYHEVIYDLYRCAPQALSGVAPYLTGELLADKLETRLKVVGLVGELFSLPGRVISEEFGSIFLEFLKRLTDRVVEVRMAILDHIKNCLLSDPMRAEASQIISALCDRLLDYDENIRKQVVAVICDVAVNALTSIPVDTMKLVAERLRDKAILVKTYTMERLTELFRVYCLWCADGKVGTGEFDWIPGKILRCLYDKDFRSDTIEYILCSSLFPSDFSVRDKVKHWIQIFSGFDKVETKAFEKILEQRQRIQQEMQRYLSIKQTQQSADAPEMQKKILFGFRVMSRAFSDPPKTEQNFLILDQLKDANIWKILTNLLDPKTSIMQASRIRDDMLKILSEKHSLYEFLSTLSIKCSYLLFSKEYVKEILAEVSARKSSKNILGIQPCMDFLGLLACFCPSLFDGAEEELISFLKGDDEMIKEGTLKILAKAGGTIRENLIVLASSVDLLLERICVEGNRNQAKYAVHALASITKDDGLKSLSVLYKRLVDMLEDKRHQPAVLQCLGCIAQIAMPVYETRESEVVEFIRSKILKLKSETVDDKKLSWDDKSEICQLKIYGIKTLVKSYMPFKDAHLRAGVDDLLGLLKNILSFGEVSEDLESSSVDKAHLRLAAAKAVLRLSRHWDDKIPIEIFHLTLKTPEIPFPTAKKIFLGKVHQYVKDRVLETKYACSFLFDITGSNVLESEEEKHNLADIIQHSYQTKVRKISAQTDANSVTLYPHHILPYLVHALAHHSCPDVEKCKDVKEYEMIYRQLYLIISMLLHKEDDGKAEDIDKEQECVSTIIFIFHSIKQSEDVADATKSKNSHAICELGLSIINHLTQKEPNLQGEITPVSLPPTLYKPSEKVEGDKSQVGEDKLWLADETVLAHFRALKLESHANASVLHQTSENEVMIDEESDGNEIPLGKIVERLRAQGTKTRKGKKNKSVPAEDENGKNDVDVLKMVREINLDHLRMLDNFESSNGHKHSPDERADICQRDQKGNKRNADDGTSVVSVPKRRRSSSGHSPYKFSNSGPKVPLKASEEELHQEREMDKNVSADSHDENSDQEKSLETISPRKRKKNLSSKLKITESDWALTDLENQNKGGNYSERSRSAESGDSKLKSASGSMKKQKRKNMAGLAKCSTDKNKLVKDESFVFLQTCLSKGDGFQYPPCHMLNLCGFRILIDCPLDLLASTIFSPVPYCVGSEASEYPSDVSLDAQNPIQKKQKLERQLTPADLVCAEPWYKTVKALHLWEPSLIDIVLISNPMGLLGLPFLTQNPGFGAKIYMTEAAAKIGQLMMEDLVSMHTEFRCFHGPENSSFPGWIKNLDREEVPDLLKKVVFGETGDDLGSWMRLYSLADIESCMKKVQAVKFAEEVCYNGTLIIKALSSGLDIGACNWLINGPNGSLSYVSNSISVSHHARNFDFHGLKGTDVMVYSDFSCLQSAEVTENGCISPALDNDYISTISSDKKDEKLAASLLNAEDSLEEKEKLAFVCSCAAESAAVGGSTLITITRIGVVLQLLELMSNSLESSSVKVPIFVISSVAEELLAYTNTIPEWLCEQRQEKIISGEPSFGHLKLIKDKKIHLFPAIHSPNLITSWQEPCVVFAPHCSLRLGPSVQLLQRWRGDPKSLLVLEDGIISGLGLLPFRPIAMKILQCSFLSGIRLQKLPALLSVLQPKIVLVPDAVNLRINLAEMKTISILNYFENKTLHISRIADNPSVEIKTDLASKLSWRKLRQHENFGIARLKGDLLMEDGKHRLVSGLEQEESSGKARALRHWGSVAPESLLDALLKVGIKGSIEHSTCDSGSEDKSIIHISNPSSGLIETSEMGGTAITTDNENVASQIFQAIDGILDGI